MGKKKPARSCVQIFDWYRALASLNLDPSASSLTQEELRHFETKVEKHSHYKEQLELSHQKLQHVEALGDKEHIRRNQEKYNTLAEKTREMGYKVKTDTTDRMSDRSWLS